MTRGAFIPCNLGCTPWRQQPAASCGATRAARLALTDEVAPDALWPEPAARGSENFSLKVHKKQVWPSGVMKCDLCEGRFNGWRGT
eukprot:2440473-Prymnesium_polylepis.1